MQCLAEASEKHHVQKSWKEVVPSAYHNFGKVFLKELFDKLPQRRKWDHAIKLVPGAEPFSSKLYPMLPNEKDDELDRFLDDNLMSSRIHLSKSPMASPVFFIKKKGGSLQFVQDYRKLNVMITKNMYPLPLTPNFMSRVSKAKYSTKLDVRWGYNNVGSKREMNGKQCSEQIGWFEPLVMFFGLCNSPATFHEQAI